MNFLLLSYERLYGYQVSLSSFLCLGDTGGGGVILTLPWYLTLQKHVDNLTVKIKWNNLCCSMMLDVQFPN